MKKQSFIKGSVILITSALIAKAIGALFKIPITNMLGGLGMSCFSGAYGLFLPIYAVTANGLTTSAAKLTAESCATGDYDGIRRIHKTALLMFSAMGIVGCLVIAILSVPFAEKAAVCPEAWLSVLMIAPSALFGCITAVYRGVREGMSDMYPTALSQVIESLVRLTAGLGLCHYVITHAEAVLSFLPKGTTIESAAAAAAVLGISLSTLVGTLFLRVSGTGLPKTAKRIKPDRKTAKALMKIFVPVALGAAAANLTTLIDLGTMVRGLKKAYDSAPALFADKYGLTDDTAPEFIYGSFMGLAVTVFNIVPSVTNMFGKSILPLISACKAEGNTHGVKRLTEKVIAVTGFIALPCGLGICALSKEVLSFLFGDRTTECAVSWESLSILGIAVIFTCLSSTMFSCYQAAGRADIPVKLMLTGAAVKLIGNLLLIPIPEINASGAALSTLLCYAVIFTLSVLFYNKAASCKISLKSLLPPLLSGILCAVTAFLVYPILPFGNMLSLPIAAACSGVVYLLAEIVSGGIKIFFTK